MAVVVPVIRSCLASLIIAIFVLTSDAWAQERPNPTRTIDLSSRKAKRQVVDTILSQAPKRAKIAALRHEAFIDQFGTQFSIETDLPGVSLQPFANVLASVIHGSELGLVRVMAVQLNQIPTLCGSVAAVACYLPDDPVNSFAGQIWFAVDDPDVVHTLVHEYGHHVDNQLINLGHLNRWHFGSGCDSGGDGSRDWFFERELEDKIFTRSGFSCDPISPWDLQLAELFAEDFVATNGLAGWRIPGALPPSAAQRSALLTDFERPFSTRVFRWGGRIHARKIRHRGFRVKHWTFVRLRMNGSRGKDFDLFLYPRRGNKSIAESRRRSASETVLTFVPPGTYDAVVFAYRGAGHFSVSFGLL